MVREASSQIFLQTGERLPPVFGLYLLESGARLAIHALTDTGSARTATAIATGDSVWNASLIPSTFLGNL